MTNTRKTKLTVSVVIPAFNEGETISDIVQRVLKSCPKAEVIVVDDGSADDTAKFAEQAGAKVLRHPYNIGNGASVKQGCLNATGDIVVLMDGDGQHQPEDIPTLLAAMDDYDMCVAARTKNSKTSKFRNFGNLMLNRIATMITGMKVMDLTSGFRAVKRDCLLECVHLFPKRYSYPTTITMALAQGNHFIKYEPMDSICKREHGQSNIRPFSDFIRFINIMMRMVILFSPQKFFLPLSLASTFLGISLGLYQLWHSGGVFGASLLLILSGVSFFCFGLLAEQLSALRRQAGEIREP